MGPIDETPDMGMITPGIPIRHVRPVSARIERFQPKLLDYAPRHDDAAQRARAIVLPP
jgi:hypothetical protein